MLKNLKPYFDFSKNERVGIIIMLIILVLLLLANPIIDAFVLHRQNPDEAFLKKVKFFEEHIKIAPRKSEPAAQTHFKPFDPNAVSADELEEMGLPAPLAKRLIHYREAGGTFRTTEDLKKVYGLSGELFAELEPFVVISPADGPPVKNNEAQKPKTESSNNPIRENAKPVFTTVELNSADTLTLQQLNGIGPVLAKRIVAYRLLLGGFCNADQLTEVYGVSPETLAQIRPYLAIDTALVVKLNLNTATFKELNRHPYIEYAECKALMKYRDVMGSFKSLDAILKNNLMPPTTFEKIKPYLSVD